METNRADNLLSQIRVIASDPNRGLAPHEFDRLLVLVRRLDAHLTSGADLPADWKQEI